MRLSFPLALTREQFADAVLQAPAIARPAWYFRWATTATVISFFAAIGFLLTASYGHATVRGPWVLRAALVALAAGFIVNFIGRRNARSILLHATHMTAPARTLTLEEAGLRFTGPTHDLFHAWADFTGVGDHNGMVYLMLDSITFYPLSHAIFESAAEKNEFVRLVRSKLTSPPAAIAAVRPPRVPLTRARTIRALANDAIRLALGMRVAPEAMGQSWGTILALVGIGILVPAVPTLWANGIHVEWNWYTVPGALLHVSLILAASICSAYAIARPAAVSSILCAGLLASIAIDIVAAIFVAAGSGIPNFSRFTSQLGWFPGAWLALALATCVSRLIPRGERRLGAVMACVLLIALPLANVYRDRQLWSVPESPEEGAQAKAPRMGAASEDAFYKQPVLLEQELARVRPGRKGVVDVFLVGMAGYGDQDVFMREIDSVSKMFRERFDAEGHVVRLVNNRKTLLDVPIASKTSLRAALKRIAEVMDTDEDVLVLFMTSHGSEDHRFSLSLWPMQFHELDPAALRTALDEAGIRFRVVVLSACYSGGFVKPLEGPDTLVITASAADKNSFGCSNENDWTYFGKAYFDEALRKTHSFVKAFEMAKPAIAAREAKEKFTASEPQISIGAGIVAKLDQLEAQLDGMPSGSR